MATRDAGDVKLLALQKQHAKKTRTLMGSIDALQKKVQTLKAQGRESYRTVSFDTLACTVEVTVGPI
jgi:hypothetical protein